MGKPTHGIRRYGYLKRMLGYFNTQEDVPRGQVRPEHGGKHSGMMDPREVVNKIAKGKGDDFTPYDRELARRLVDRA